MTYCKENIGPPSLPQILEWAKKSGVQKSDALRLSDRLPFRHALGNPLPPPSPFLSI